MDFRLFIPITKVDVEKRLVYGTVAEEIPDRADEIMDYKSARPEFEAWSAEIAKASDGRSLGNLRAMHGQVAAGKLERLAFDDDAKRIECCGKVVDDIEWKKVLEGVYTGFSMGGKYLNRWRDRENPNLTRYTPKPSEISLVDHPCIPTATFEVLKEDGSRELRKFRSTKPLNKIGARNSKADLERIQQMHDAAVALGASCGTGEGLCDDTANAGFDNETGKYAKITAYNNDVICKILDRITSIVETQGARIATLEAQPVAGGPVLRGTRTVSKSDDARGTSTGAAGDPVVSFRKHLDTLAPEQRALALMKFSLANPLPSAPGNRR
jgi:hypothetical protein